MSGEMDVSHPGTGSLRDAPAKPSFRSFKKKYAKLKIRFEIGMRESDKLVREELRIEDLSKRIQAQNDQLLEALLEFNDNLHVSPNLRFDLKTPEDAPSMPTPESDFLTNNDPAMATTVLQNAKADMTTGRITAQEYHDVEGAVKLGPAFAPTQQYISLLKVPHTTPQSEEQRQSADGNFEDSLGFLTPEHEAEYYLAMDARLGDEAAGLQLNGASEKPAPLEREREAALRNPASVYNWLRRNQPHIFLQDHENASDKSGSRPNRSSKKAQPRKEEEYDEETASVDTGPTSNPKNKRKRDEDGGYRPKGGGSRSRKKKEDGGPISKRASKRASG